MTKNMFVVYWGMLSIAIILAIRGYPQEGLYTDEYIFLSLCMITYLTLNFMFFIAHSLYIFEPILLIFILYLFVFFIDPMMNIASGTTACMGFDVMEGCKKATIVFMFAYLLFLFGYYGTIKKPVYYGASISKGYIKNYGETEWRGSKVESAAFLIWIISFAFGCIELVSKGMSISYFLTLGLAGNIDNLYADSAFGFLGNFRFSMITAWVYLFVCNRKSLKTKICGILTLEYFILRGFRHSLFVLIFAPILYPYIKEKKKPKTSTLILLLIIVIAVMGIMQFIRGALRSGSSIDWSTFDATIFIDAIKGNCDVYKTFYGMVVAVPGELNYQLGMCSIVSVITMIIPRRIWPGKPVSPIITNLGMFCGTQAANSGYAMPNISEYYLDFGPIGTAVCLFIFGQVLQKMKNLYEYKYYDRHSLILYSIMFPALLQIVLRGYSPSYIYLLLFYAFPILVIKYLDTH